MPVTEGLADLRGQFIQQRPARQIRPFFLELLGVADRELRLALNFEVFNVSNSWSPTSIATQEYTATKGVLTPTPTAWGYGTADGGFPDGTQARRMQISARLTF